MPLFPVDFFQGRHFDNAQRGHHFVVVIAGQTVAIQLMEDDVVIEACGATGPLAPLAADAPEKLDGRPVLWPKIDLGRGEVFRP